MRAGSIIQLAPLAVLASAAALTAAARAEPPRVVEPGKEPRRVLRSTPELNRTERINIEVKQTRRRERPDLKQSSASVGPTVLLAFDVTPTAIADDRISFTIRVVESNIANRGDMPPGAVETLSRSLGPLRDIHGTGQVSQLGAGFVIEWPQMKSLPDAARGFLRQVDEMMQALIVERPADPVGTAAKWALATQVAGPGGAPVAHEAVFELIALREHEASIACVVDLADENDSTVTRPGATAPATRDRAAVRHIRNSTVPTGGVIPAGSITIRNTTEFLVPVDERQMRERDVQEISATISRPAPASAAPAAAP